MIIDGSVLFLFLTRPNRLPAEILGLLRSGDTELAISGAAFYDFAAQHRRGISSLAPRELRDSCHELGVDILDVSDDEFLLAGELELDTKNPWTRITAVQAKILGRPIISDKPIYAAAGVEVVWP